MIPASCTALLAQGATQMGVKLSALHQEQLLAYLALLDKWNLAYNLTAVRDPVAMVTRHILDGLSLVPWIRGRSLLDVGTGAGIPGMMLAICYPDMPVTLLDSNGKKTRFLVQAAAELQLSNVTVAKTRVESFPVDAFDQITCRAFASLADFVNAVAGRLAPGAQLLAMKGIRPDDEIACLPTGFGVTRVVELAVPGLDEARHLVVMEAMTTSVPVQENESR